MKQAFALIALVLSAAATRADFIMQQKVESPEQNGVVTLKIKGSQTRMDMPTERIGDVSLIQDLNTGDRITMIHRQKLAHFESGAEFKERMAEHTEGGSDTEVPDPVDTGKTMKVGAYDTEVYTWTNNHYWGGTFWVAKDYPGYAKIKPILVQVEQSPARQMAHRATPRLTAFPGMVVKSKVESPIGEINSTLISAKEEPVPDTTFRVPPDYRVEGLKVMPGRSTPPPKQ